MNVQLIIYAVIVIVVLGLIYGIIRQFTNEGDESDIYLRRNTNCSKACGDNYFSDLRTCNQDAKCLKEQSPNFNACLSKC